MNPASKLSLSLLFVGAVASALFAVARGSAPSAAGDARTLTTERAPATTKSEPFLLIVPTTSIDAGLGALDALGVHAATRESDDARVAALGLSLAPEPSLAEVKSALVALIALLESEPARERGGALPDGALDSMGRAALPLLTSATPLAVRRISASDGTLALAIVDGCPSPLPESAKCVRAWDHASDSDPSVKRAKHLTWGLSLAAVFTVSDPQARAALKDAFRLRMAKADGTVSFAFTKSDLARSTTGAQAVHDVAARAETVVAKGGGTVPRPLRLLASPFPEGALVPWLALPEDALVVSPRLGVLTKLEDFARECDDVVHGSAARWLYRPASL